MASRRLCRASMSTDSLIEQFAARLDRAGLLIGKIERAPWIDIFEQRVPKRLPRSFGAFVRRYAFLPFVRLDHESILIRTRIDIHKQVARSFVALVEDLLAGDSEPMAD